MTAFGLAAIVAAALAGCGGSSPAKTSTATGDTATGTDSATNTGTASAPSAGGTTGDVGSGTGTAAGPSTSTVSQPDPSAELEPVMAAVVKLGYCDGNWKSALEQANSSRPTGVTELKESWTCATATYGTQILRWGSQDEAQTNVKALIESAKSTGNDPSTINMLLQGDYLVAVSNAQAPNTTDTAALKTLQESIGGEVGPMTELAK